jgi:hypothetical protein
MKRLIQARSAACIVPVLIIAVLLCGSGVGFAADKNVSAATEEMSGKYTILNPRPNKAPIDVVPLAARLSSLEGKTVAIVANYNDTMPAIAREMTKVAPGVKVLWISDLPVTVGQSPRPADLNEAGITNMSLADFEKNPKQADAIIVGNGF